MEEEVRKREEEECDFMTKDCRRTLTSSRSDRLHPINTRSRLRPIFRQRDDLHTGDPRRSGDPRTPDSSSMQTSSARIPTDHRLGRYPPDYDTPSIQHFHLAATTTNDPAASPPQPGGTDLVASILPAARRQRRYDTNDDDLIMTETLV